MPTVSKTPLNFLLYATPTVGMPWERAAMQACIRETDKEIAQANNSLDLALIILADNMCPRAQFRRELLPDPAACDGVAFNRVIRGEGMGNQKETRG